EATREITALLDREPSLLQQLGFIGITVGDRLAELQLRIQWRQSRRSPPRCLECGSTAIVPIPGAGEFLHPETGERVVVVSSGWADCAPWFAEFSPEGEQINTPPATANGGNSGS